MDMGTLGVTPVMNVGNKSDGGMFGGGDGGFIWVLFLILLLGGGSGFGGLGGNAAAATVGLNNEFLYTQQKIDTTNQGMNAGFAGVNQGLCALGHQADIQFCGVNRNIDQSRFEAAQNTAAIMKNSDDNTQKILDRMQAYEIQELRDRVQTCMAEKSNMEQNVFLVNQLHPYPIPATPVGYNFGYGFGGAGYAAAATPFGGACYAN